MATLSAAAAAAGQQTAAAALCRHAPFSQQAVGHIATGLAASRRQNLMTCSWRNQGMSSRRVRCGRVVGSVLELDTAAVGGEGQEAADADVAGQASEQQQFVWQKQWYPAAILRDLDPRLPTAVTILGLPLVIWWDSTSTDWRVFQDYCPHRLAPLSEGRIHESGHLQCSYHGWTFDATGSCTSIPQQPKDGPPVHTSPRACARVVPSQSHQGMLWVWPDGSPSAADESRAAPPPPTVPEIDDPVYKSDIAMTDVPYGYEILVENLVDPSHVPFAHHRIMGNRKDGKPLNLRVQSISKEGVKGLNEKSPFNFVAPCMISLELTLPPRKKNALMSKLSHILGGGKENADEEKNISKKFVLVFYCVPTLPGQARAIYTFPNNIVPGFVKLIPRWLRHVEQMKVFDSDTFFLHQLERKLAAAGGSAASSRVYFTPATADAFVSAFRKWLNEFAGQGPSWPSSVDTKLPPSPSREVLMDRQWGHVKHCLSCQGAQKGLERLRVALWCASFVILASLAYMASTQPQPLPKIVVQGLVALFVACAGVAAYLGKYIYGTFFFTDYVHALVD